MGIERQKQIFEHEGHEGRARDSPRLKIEIQFRREIQKACRLVKRAFLFLLSRISRARRPGLKSQTRFALELATQLDASGEFR